MTRSGTAFRLVPLAPLTGGTGFGSSLTARDPESGLWPTPEASDASGGRVSREIGGSRPSGASRSVTLGTMVAHRERTIDGLWTTPAADDTGHRKDRYAQGGTALSTQAGGSLNPTWVEWLMGFPLGWTDLGR
jgi:hypothetical protein